MKTLYISDLDGTLLDSSAQIPEKTKQALNRLIANGMFFTVASARTVASVSKILEGIAVNVPAVLMNGAAVYDLSAGKYIKTESISDEGKRCLIDAVHECGISGFLYCIDGVLSTYYENVTSPNAEAFIAERVIKYDKRFTHVESFEECLANNIVYFSVSDKAEKLEGARRQLEKCPDLHVEYYTDTYNEGFRYLEVCSKTVSKSSAVKFLKSTYKFGKAVGFGDNYNDLPMFDACEESCAVGNALPEVKARASKIIGTHTENGVAEYLLKEFGLTW